MKKIYFFAFILLNLLSSCSSDTPEENNLTASFNLSATTVNVGDDIKVTNKSTSSKEIVSYTFNFGNETSSTEKEPTFYYDRPGDFNVKLVIKDVNGNVATSTITVTVNAENSLLLKNQLIGGSDVYPIEIGINDNKIFYTESYRSVTTSTTSYYRHVEYDDATKTFATKIITEKNGNSGHAQTTYLNNGNKIVNVVQSMSSYAGTIETEFNTDWNPVRSGSSGTIYGSVKNNDQYYFYGSYENNPAIEIRNNEGKLVSRKTYESTIKNGFIGNLIKTGTTYVAFGGKYETSSSSSLLNYKPLLLFLNENLEITSQKTFDTSTLKDIVIDWNQVNGSFKAIKLTNGNLALYSHNELRITTGQGDELKLIKLSNTGNIQGIIEIENGFIASSFQRLEKYDNSGNVLKSISYPGLYNSGFVKKGDLYYFAAGCGSSYENISVLEIKLGAVDANLNFKKI
ncbi:PKD domain-containing protein [Flavobacterium humidisoli]|uniref:PKD domain-containing protein n=1 Tax=Flavobacterium humidisoli TaxID=2937442 RepID=A0ABY4LWU8_9FLAO|nr:PKD domain-containing protein [Flavobacterium humidisoli]UPZ17043.1 PKD domain-containing protein [Flavobacterium humidisoli]